jgi:hypothetical protein
VFTFLTVVLPVIAGVLVAFAKAPEAGKRFSVTLRLIVAVLCAATAIAAWEQHLEDAESKSEDAKRSRDLTAEISKLRTVAPLRKEAADLAKEMLDFYNGREHYKDRFKPGQALSPSETAEALAWYAQTVSLYHAQFEKRVLGITEQIRVATGMDVVGIQGDARGVKFAPEVGDIATRLSTLAASLP